MTPTNLTPGWRSRQEIERASLAFNGPPAVRESPATPFLHVREAGRQGSPPTQRTARAARPDRRNGQGAHSSLGKVPPQGAGFEQLLQLLLGVFVEAEARGAVAQALERARQSSPLANEGFSERCLSIVLHSETNDGSGCPLSIERWEVRHLTGSGKVRERGATDLGCEEACESRELGRHDETRLGPAPAAASKKPRGAFPCRDGGEFEVSWPRRGDCSAGGAANFARGFCCWVVVARAVHLRRACRNARGGCPRLPS